MDELSKQRVPFVFMVDFLMKNIKIFTDNEIENNGLYIDFKRFKSLKTKDNSFGEFQLKSFPETLEEYKEGFTMVQDHLKKGDSYLANYTRKTEIECNRTLEQLFYSTQAKYKILYRDQFVCFSPETFIEIQDNRISTHPMKGTIDASVPDAKNILKNDVKEKAEHYTVVDLLRNDLSMVANDVIVEEFQRVDLIHTGNKDLYAMSSEISGQIKSEYSGKTGTILRKLLPAGSILGAPKTKTLEIILAAERYERGYYTGICGRFDGKNLDSCVMIRFIEKDNGKLYFKSGGGITHLSNLADEYQEMKNKIYVPVH